MVIGRMISLLLDLGWEFVSIEEARSSGYLYKKEDKLVIAYGVDHGHIKKECYQHKLQADLIAAVNLAFNLELDNFLTYNTDCKEYNISKLEIWFLAVKVEKMGGVVQRDLYLYHKGKDPVNYFEGKTLLSAHNLGKLMQPYLECFFTETPTIARIDPKEVGDYD